MKKFLLVFLVGALAISLMGLSCTKKEEQSESSMETFTGSLKELIDRGQASKCTFQMDMEGIETEAVVYIAGQKSYSEMETKDNTGKTYKTYSIIDGEWMYTWSTMTPGTGLKMNLKEMEEMGEEYEDDQEAKSEFDYQKNYEQEFEYKCQNWLQDNSKFVPPANIEFTDWSQLMKDFTEEMNTSMGDLCGNCDVISDEEQRKECRESLGCD